MGRGITSNFVLSLGIERHNMRHAVQQFVPRPDERDLEAYCRKEHRKPISSLERIQNIYRFRELPPESMSADCSRAFPSIPCE